MQLVPILALSVLDVVHPTAEPATPKIEACLSQREMREEIAQHHVVEPWLHCAQRVWERRFALSRAEQRRVASST
jgi:hypothetical protein